jgi:hypothetical protein
MGRFSRAESDGDSTLQLRSMSVGSPGPLTSASPSQLGAMGGMNSGDRGTCLALSGLPDPRENQSSSYDCVEPPSDPFRDKLMWLSALLSPSTWNDVVSSGQLYEACGSHEMFTSEDLTLARGEITERCELVAALSISAISPSQKSIDEVLKSHDAFGPIGRKSLPIEPCSPMALTC